MSYLVLVASRPTIPTSSPLYRILANNEYYTIFDIKASKLSVNDKIIVAKAVDKCIKSVPHSISTYYMNLLVASVHEKLGLDIPYEVLYTADGPTKPYSIQAQAYGLDRLLSDPNECPRGELPLLFLPDFASTLYLTLRRLLKLSPKKWDNDFSRTYYKPKFATIKT